MKCHTCRTKSVISIGITGEIVYAETTGTGGNKQTSENIDLKFCSPECIAQYLRTRQTEEQGMKKCRCLQCENTWFPRSVNRPALCPECRSLNWDKPKNVKKNKHF